jgi:hypothetical protein
LAAGALGGAGLPATGGGGGVLPTGLAAGGGGVLPAGGGGVLPAGGGGVLPAGGGEGVLPAAGGEGVLPAAGGAFPAAGLAGDLAPLSPAFGAEVAGVEAGVRAGLILTFLGFPKSSSSFSESS